jgi:ferredoxin-like protein FixX
LCMCIALCPVKLYSVIDSSLRCYRDTK